MKWIRFCSAIVATLGLTTVAQADLMNLFGGHGSCGHGKSCGCDSTCQPCCCKPTITRPCGVTVHTYQRKCSDIKPPCCDTCCAPSSCCAPANCCAPAAACCAPAAACCAPAAPAACCAPAAPACCPEPAKCCAPAAPACCPPAAAACCAPAAPACCPSAAPCCDNSCCDSGCGHGHGGLFGKLFHHRAKGVCVKEVEYCCADPCEVAQLIYQSQTACYAKDREKAIDDLGDYSCECNPEIMVAMIYALNDADEEVRAEAADELGDQLRAHPCCCSKEVTAALTCALADCDKDVRKQAEEALEACGYCIVDGCCCECCNTGCCNSCGSTAPNAAPTPAPAEGAAPAPAPPEDPKAYFPSRLRQQQTKNTSKSPNRLANLFGLVD